MGPVRSRFAAGDASPGTVGACFRLRCLWCVACRYAHGDRARARYSIDVEERDGGLEKGHAAADGRGGASAESGGCVVSGSKSLGGGRGGCGGDWVGRGVVVSGEFAGGGVSAFG